MSELIGKGWLFVHPDLGSPGSGEGGEGAESVGIRLSNRGGIALVRGRALVRQAIYLLLSTRKGERVMRPDYGCELDRLVFLPNDVTTAGLAIHYTRRAVEQWEPRVEILSLDASPHPDDPSRLEILLEYRLDAGGFEDRLSYSVDLAGGQD